MKPAADAQKALDQATGIIDLLQGAAAHDAIQPPSNSESLAWALSAVRDLLEIVRTGMGDLASSRNSEVALNEGAEDPQ